MYDLGIGSQVNFISCPEFIFRKDTMLGNKLNIFIGNIGGQTFGSGSKVAQATLYGFFSPFCT